MSALGFVMLFLGALFNILDLTAVIFASIILMVARREIGYKSLFIYFVTVAITVLIPSTLVVGIEYAIIGLYPIIEPVFSRQKKFVKWVLKVIYFVLASLGIFLISRFLVADAPLYMDILLGVSCVLVFFLYDILLFRFSLYYGFKLRNKLRIDKFFNQN